MRSVLIVDDDKSLTIALAVRLRQAGFNVWIAHNADQAAAMAVRERPDVIVLDIDMPRVSGLEFHQCLRFAKRSANIPVVYLSGHDSTEQKRIAFEQGARAFIGKPYHIADLVATLQRVIEPVKCAS
jgi:DNA-binding response OmpR family regulator